MDFEINAMGTLNLLEAVRTKSPDTIFLYASTNKVYGDLENFTYREVDKRYVCNEHPHGFDESITLAFHSPYGCSKGAADQYVLDYARMFNIRSVVFRHSTLYGGRQHATVDQGWIGWFCQKAMEARNGQTPPPFTISGNGKQVRDILYSTDLCDLYLKAVDNIEKAKGHAFNIGGGLANSLSLLELFDFLEQEMSVVLKYTHLPVRASDQKVFISKNEKAKSLIEWEPRITTQQGIRHVLEWLDDA